MSRSAQIHRPERLTIAGARLVELIEELGRPVLRPFEFFLQVERLYDERGQRRLYLRADHPDAEECRRLRHNLTAAGLIAADRDYGSRIIRVLSVSDRPAEAIATLLDPTCHVSHLSAMQRWGLTNRRPEALHLTRPSRALALARLREHHAAFYEAHEQPPFEPILVAHPDRVRRRPIHLLQTKEAGLSIVSRSDGVRVATIAQTLLDTLLRPDLCGGMAHVIDVWAEHVEAHLDEVADLVDRAPSAIAKSRAGHILEERLGLAPPILDSWKALAQRGGSRKLDPARPFSPEYSEAWMISLNA